MPDASWFDPVAVHLGPFPIRWYSLAYVLGFVISFFIAKYRYFPRHKIDLKNLDPFMSSIILGVIIGGRLGHVFFYDPLYYISSPLDIFKLWHGGMAFHGAILGVLVSLLYISKRYGINFWILSDFVCLMAPVGIFFGRIANFINGELVGRPTDMPWGIIFPHIDQFTRHPSQLYEAVCEGLILGAGLYYIYKRGKSPGITTAYFLVFYGMIRFVMQLFRMPEYFYNASLLGMDTGQLLSAAMVVLGIYVYSLVRIKYK